MFFVYDYNMEDDEGFVRFWFGCCWDWDWRGLLGVKVGVGRIVGFYLLCIYLWLYGRIFYVNINGIFLILYLKINSNYNNF